MPQRAIRYRKPPRRAVAPLRDEVASARATFVDRAPLAVVLGGALLLSGLGHVIGMLGASRVSHSVASPPPQDTVRIAVVSRPPPPRAIEETKPELSRPVPRKKITGPRRPPASVPASSPAAPPPPNEEKPSENVSPILIPGVAFSATSPTGALKVRTGNTLYGQPGVDSSGAESRPYRAKEYAPTYALTEEPVFLDNVSAEQMRKVYPEEARRAKKEAVVRVKLIIDDDGSVARVTVMSDPGDGFRNAALKVAHLYRFKPARVDGRAVATEIAFTIHFELD